MLKTCHIYYTGVLLKLTYGFYYYSVYKSRYEYYRSLQGLCEELLYNHKYYRSYAKVHSSHKVVWIFHSGVNTLSKDPK